MTHPLRLGLVGAGAVGALHLAAAASLPEVAVVAVCDVRRETAEQAAAGLSARAYRDHTSMFAAGGLDAVIVTAPHALHAPITVDAAAAGLHVLVEKPMATTVGGCRRMIEACTRYGVRLAVGHMLRYLPTVREAGRLLRTGALGRPVVITERRTSPYGPGSRPAWFFDSQLAGGGIVMNVGTHSIDKAQWLSAARVTRVLGYTWQKPQLGVETEAVGLLELSNGVRVALSVTGTGLPFQDETEVVCEHGALRLSRQDGLWTYQDDRHVQRLAPAPGDTAEAFRAQLADFAASCADGRPPAVDGEYGHSVVATALALYESARQGYQVSTGAPPEQREEPGA